MDSYFEYSTAILYVIIGIIGTSILRRSMNPRLSIALQNRYLTLFVLLFALFAACRQVSPGIGGRDALSYIEDFEDAMVSGVGERKGATNIEPGFLLINYSIRYITDNWRIYFALLYGFIAFSYAYTIRKLSTTYMVFIPMVLLSYLYIKGFNTLRSHCAISVMLIGLTYIDTKKWRSLVILLSSILIHRMSIIFVPIWFFYHILKKYLTDMSRMWFVVIGIAGVIFSFLAAKFLQNYILLIGLLEGTDAFYLEKNVGSNILDSYPMFFAHAVLFFAISVFYNKIFWSDKDKVLRTLFLYDLWIVPAGLILGMWRFANYLYVLRLCLWGIILYNFKRSKSPNTRQLIDLVAWFIFIAWFIFRFSREWEDTGTSPYFFSISQ